MKRAFILTILVFIMGLSFSTGADAREKIQIRVQIMVQADADIQSAIEKQLRQGFQALGDVIVVNEKPDFEIRVIAMESMSKEKEKTGIALATAFLRPYIRSGIPEMISRRCQENPDAGKAAGSLEKLQIYKDHLLQFGSPNDIEQICRDIVLNFKTNILE
jgi:hypothetical protein